MHLSGRKGPGGSRACRRLFRPCFFGRIDAMLWYSKGVNPNPFNPSPRHEPGPEPSACVVRSGRTAVCAQHDDPSTRGKHAACWQAAGLGLFSSFCQKTGFRPSGAVASARVPTRDKARVVQFVLLEYRFAPARRSAKRSACRQEPRPELFSSFCRNTGLLPPGAVPGALRAERSQGQSCSVRSAKTQVAPAQRERHACRQEPGPKLFSKRTRRAFSGRGSKSQTGALLGGPAGRRWQAGYEVAKRKPATHYWATGHIVLRAFQPARTAKTPSNGIDLLRSSFCRKRGIHHRRSLKVKRAGRAWWRRRLVTGHRFLCWHTSGVRAVVGREPVVSLRSTTGYLLASLRDERQGRFTRIDTVHFRCQRRAWQSYGPRLAPSWHPLIYRPF